MSDQTTLIEAASPTSAPDGGKGLGAATGSAVSRTLEEHRQMTLAGCYLEIKTKPKAGIPEWEDEWRYYHFFEAAEICQRLGRSIEDALAHRAAMLKRHPHGFSRAVELSWESAMYPQSD